MKQVESTLRAAIRQLAAEERARRQSLLSPSDSVLKPDFRALTSLDEVQVDGNAAAA